MRNEATYIKIRQMYINREYNKVLDAIRPLEREDKVLYDFFMGVLECDDYPTPNQYQDAAMRLKRCVDANFIPAFIPFHKCLREGKGIQENRNLAEIYVKKALEAKDPEALTWYHPENSIENEELCRLEAAKLNYTPAMRYLAEDCASYLKDYDYKSAFNWYLKAAELDDVEAQYETAIYYLNPDGSGTPVNDTSKALYWLTKAAHEHQHYDSMCKLGELCYYGEKVIKDYPLSFAWFNGASQNWVPYRYVGFGWNRPQILADEWLGYLYLNGIGTEQNDKKAYEHYMKALEIFDTDPESLFRIGTFYEEGRYVPQDYNKALAWFDKAIEQGYRDDIRMHRLELLMKMKEHKKVADELMSLVWSNSLRDEVTKMMTSLGIKFYYGLDVKQNLDEAYRLFAEASNFGCVDAMFYHGECLYYGFGTKKDVARAKEIYRKGAEAGSQDCKKRAAEV